MARDERIESIYQGWGAREMAERIVDLEDQIKAMGLDPERLDKVLRSFISDLDYDVHKTIQCGEDDGVDHYPETVEFFLSLWEEAGK